MQFLSEKNKEMDLLSSLPDIAVRRTASLRSIRQSIIF